MERMPSIFNDVLSPVTPGPSSSNTCGPYRIARLARALLGEPPRRITVRMARLGGYYDTFYSMHSHEAILAALLGQELLRCDLSTMCRQADEAGLCYDFQFVDDLPVRPSELAEMELSGDRRTIRLTGVSLGGGEIEITRLNGSDILLRGKRRETVCLGPEGARVVPEDTAAGPGQWLARLEPLFPFPQQEGAIPFRTAQEMFAFARDTGRPLWRVAFDYESALTGATEAELRAYARQVLDICRHARQQGVRPDNHFIGVTDARAARYKALREGRKLIDLGAADEACLDAMSIMEFSNAHGTIVCMPTGGASGIVPAAVYRRTAGQERDGAGERPAGRGAHRCLLLSHPLHRGHRLSGGDRRGGVHGQRRPVQHDDRRSRHHPLRRLAGRTGTDGAALQPHRGLCAGSLHRAEHGRRTNRRHLCQCGAGRDGSHRAAG